MSARGKEIIIVLGGEISKEGELSVWVYDCLDFAVELQRRYDAEKILVSGKGRDNFPMAEAVAMSELTYSGQSIVVVQCDPGKPDPETYIDKLISIFTVHIILITR